MGTKSIADVESSMSADEDLPLAEFVGEALPAEELIDYQDGAVVSRTLADVDGATLTAFALDSGQSISEHSAPHTALVQVVDGVAEITVDGELHRVEEAELLVLPADVPHALDAPERFKMLLTMMKEE